MQNRTRWNRSAVVAGLAALVVCGSASAAVVSIGALRDTTIYDDGAGEVANGAGAGLFAGRNGIAQTTRALLAFDIASAVPAGATINSVSLRLVKGAGPSAGNTMFLQRITSDWGEGSTVANGGGGGGGQATTGSATWVHTFYNTQTWTTPGGDFDAAASAGISVFGVGAYTWDAPGMAFDVQGWLDNPGSNFGWILRGTETGQSNASRFASRESSVAADRPQLTIDYTPVPAPGGVAAVALGLAGMARRRRSH